MIFSHLKTILCPWLYFQLIKFVFIRIERFILTRNVFRGRRLWDWFSWIRLMLVFYCWVLLFPAIVSRYLLFLIIFILDATIISYYLKWVIFFLLLISQNLLMGRINSWCHKRLLSIAQIIFLILNPIKYTFILWLAPWFLLE